MRDQFALEAMKILLTATLSAKIAYTSKDLAITSYEVADAMMKARS